jgi:UDP:flavonoid glycosyltransferase YjiC (YdhE family)
MIHRKREYARTNSEKEAALQSIISRRGATTAERPLLLVLCSTFATVHTGFVKRILQAAARRPDWDVILSLGDRDGERQFDSLPANVHSFPWVPVLELLPHTDVVVTNAGPNTINECIRFGVPPVVYSLGTNDQPGNAARVAYHDVGIVGDIEAETVDQFIAHVEQALCDADIQSNIERMQDRFRTYEDEQRAVRFVEEMITSSHH